MSIPNNQRLLDAIRRSDFKAFARATYHITFPGEELAWNWHLDAICYELDRVLRGATKRLIIEVPPRSLKSFLASVVFPAFYLGRNPAAQLIAASYSLDLAGKLSNDCRALMRSDWYRSIFPHVTAFASKDTETQFVTAQAGFRYATSSGGTLTGRGADLIILDDPQKSDDAQSQAKRRSLQDWFRNTLYTRLNNRQTGAMILVMQRLHIDDLAGFLRERGDWRTLSLPAIAPLAQSVQIGPNEWHHRMPGDLLHPARESQRELHDLKRTMGSYNFSAQYLQQPVPLEGELVKWGWFRQFDTLPEGQRQIVQSWDVAIKAEQIHDHSVCTTWAIIGRDYYLLNLFRDRLAFPLLRQAAIRLAGHWQANTILIEDVSSGSALIQMLNENSVVRIPRPIGIVPKLDKVSRMSAASATIEAGQVHLQAGASWQDDLRSEIAQFPYGAHDDQVDSISQFLNWARTSSGTQFGLVRISAR